MADMDIPESIRDHKNEILSEFAVMLAEEVRIHERRMTTVLNLYFRERAALRMKETINDLRAVLDELEKRA